MLIIFSSRISVTEVITASDYELKIIAIQNEKIISALFLIEEIYSTANSKSLKTTKYL